MRRPSRREMATAKKLPMTRTNWMAHSVNPNAIIPNGTQQTLGSVCIPKKSGPRKSSSGRHRHIRTPSIAPRMMLREKPTIRRKPLITFATINGLKMTPPVLLAHAFAGHGQPFPTGSPNAVCRFSIPRSESTMWLGAGKRQACQPISLYAASQVARIINQMRRRLRLPEIFRQVGVDTIYLIFDFRPNLLNQFGDLFAVKIPGMRQRHPNLFSHSAGMCVHHNDAVGQSHRFSDRMRDEQDRLTRVRTHKSCNCSCNGSVRLV